MCMYIYIYVCVLYYLYHSLLLHVIRIPLSAEPLLPALTLDLSSCRTHTTSAFSAQDAGNGKASITCITMRPRASFIWFYTSLQSIICPVYININIYKHT